MSGPLARAKGLLARRGAWLDVAGDTGGYALRLGADRRARVMLTVDEATFRALVAAPGLKRRSAGGWTALSPALPAAAPAPAAGSPGRIEGERAVMTADGRAVSLKANLGESPIAWLARRKDASGRPFLTPAEAAAGERLRRDAEIARAGPSLTMRWDALPRGGGGSAARVEPGDRAINAARRAAAALAACSTADRAMVEQVCVRESSLQLAEREAGLARRQGKLSLKAGLGALARHYRIG